MKIRSFKKCSGHGEPQGKCSSLDPCLIHTCHVTTDTRFHCRRSDTQTDLLIYLERGLELQVVPGRQNVGEGRLVRPKAALTGLKQIISLIFHLSPIGTLVRTCGGGGRYLKQGSSILVGEFFVHLVALVSVALDLEAEVFFAV